MIYAALIAAAASLIAAAVASGDEAKAREIRQGIADKLGAVALPDLEKAVAEQIPQSQSDRYGQSTNASKSQAEALRQLSETVNQKGETIDDKAAYLRSAQATSALESGAQSSLLRTLSARGLSGSGVESAMIGQSSQSSIDRGAQANLDEASQARSRMLAAVAQLGGLSTSARGQDLDALKAQDAISMFNARARQDAQNYNNGLNQQRYNNKLGLLSAQGNALNGVANDLNASGARTRQTGAGVANAAVDFGQAYDDGKKKKDY